MSSVVKMGALRRAVVLAPGVQPEVVGALRKAMDETFASQEFSAAAQKQLGFQFEFTSGSESQQIAEDIITEAEKDKEALEYLETLWKG